MSTEPILTLSGITKRYPGVVALDNVSVAVKKGEVLALIGENGAGKSTLIKTVTGAIQPDEGMITFDGKDYAGMTPALSRRLGIAAIYQEFTLAPTLTVAENIFMGQRWNSGPVMNTKQLYEKAQKVLDNFNVEISPRTLVRDLTVAYKQLVEIAKAIAQDARFIIMDEPTAPLTDNEVGVLFNIVQKLKEQGVTIIYISHRLDELFVVSDRVTVMRDGAVVETRETKGFTKPELIQLMVGRELKETFPQRNAAPGDVALELRELAGNGLEPISLQVRRGEVVGLAGLVGAGRTELARLIFGADRKESGRVLVDGKEVAIHCPKDAVACGIAMVSEDRKNQGVLLRMSIRENITVSILRDISRMGVLNRRREQEIVNQQISAMHVKTPSPEQLVGNLSGGNQQKVVLAKWMASHSKILILDEPTRGIDVGAKQEIYRLVNTLAEQGMAILVISSEMEEILGLTDRLLVLYEGRVTGVLSREEYTQEKVLQLASGETQAG